MHKLKLLTAMLALAALIALVVYCASPYSPVVGPVMDIEDVWSLEDARTESRDPLVTALENNGVPMAYDAYDNVFYCTLGMENEEAWPQIHMTAPGAKGVSLVMVDDYTYDFCSDAIRDGYTYELFTYTDDAFFYSTIVFTGLPIISVNTQGEEAIPPHVDIPAEIAISWDGEEALVSHGRAHKRGDTSLRTKPKNGVKIEFTRGADGTKKMQQDTPVFGLTDEIVLLAGSVDDQMIRDRLSWDMWNGIVKEGEPFGEMKTHYGELFVNNRYQGLYLMMKPYVYETEMAKLGAEAPATDSYYRLAGDTVYEFDRPIMQDYRSVHYEQHYAPAGMEPFASLMPYMEMIAAPSNQKFSDMALQCLDIDSVIRYMLFVHACGMMDNEKNNLCIWAHQSDEGVKYRFVPWDLDVSWGLNDEMTSEVVYRLPLFNRLVGLDCGGIVRERTEKIWQEMRETAFNQTYLDQLVAQYEKELNQTGAYYRNAVKWNMGSSYLDMYNIYAYALARFDMLDRRIEEIASEENRDRYLRIEGYTTFVEEPLETVMQEDAAL